MDAPVKKKKNATQCTIEQQCFWKNSHDLNPPVYLLLLCPSCYRYLLTNLLTRIWKWEQDRQQTGNLKIRDKWAYMTPTKKIIQRKTSWGSKGAFTRIFAAAKSLHYFTSTKLLHYFTWSVLKTFFFGMIHENSKWVTYWKNWRNYYMYMVIIHINCTIIRYWLIIGTCKIIRYIKLLPIMRYYKYQKKSDSFSYHRYATVSGPPPPGKTSDHTHIWVNNL